jgi:serine protease AprX
MHGCDRRRSSWVGSCLGLVFALLPAAAAADVSGRPAAYGSPSRVIVQVEPSAESAVQSLVVRLGGEVGRQLGIVGGFAAVVPASAVGRLSGAPGVRAVTPDGRVHVQAAGSTGGGGEVFSAYPAALGADRVWRTGNRGQGATVALVDTGVSPSPDLDGRVLPVTVDATGRTAACQNLSGEADCYDNYGHGTFVAGVIAGDGSASTGRWTGVAPRANVVSVKVAGRDGAADVSGVLAAIQWVVSFKDRYGIRVLNLSLGTDSTQSYRTDPFNYAVERAWDAGIAVVVAASNRGPAPGTISKPGDDPVALTVGAVDDRGTAGVGDDELPKFSSRGPTAADGLAKPDVVAPGAHLVSLRSVGSTIDNAFPGYLDGSYHRGSGTSFAAAAVSGVVALMCSRNPSLTPNRVKYAVTQTARAVRASTDRMAVGAGEVDAYAATVNPPAGVANGGVTRSNGTGLLDASRGQVRVQTGTDQVLVNGVLTAQLVAWDPTGFLLGWNPTGWYTSTWYLNRWRPVVWAGNDWPGHNWGGGEWEGTDVARSYGAPTSGSAWYGAWE